MLFFGPSNPPLFIFIFIGVAPFTLSAKKPINAHMHYYCQGHKKPQEQRLKEKSKSNFQTRNKTRLCDSKTKNTWTKNKNIWCAKQTWKQIFIMLTYANMNMKKTWKSYDARSCLRLMLSNLKELKGSYSYLYPFKDLTQERF